MDGSRLWLLLAGLLVPAAAVAGEVEEGAKGPGLTAAEAIEVCEPEGQRQYLASLVCPDSSHPTFERQGSFGMRSPFPGPLSSEEANALLLRLMGDPTLRPGEPDFHMVDGYEVVCPDSTVFVYMDMYHCDAEGPPPAPPGFTLLR